MSTRIDTRIQSRVKVIQPLRYGLTLVEIMIGLVLLVAAGAIVFPMLMNRLHEQAFESAADVTNEQLLLARAHAQSTGAAVEVTYSQATSQVQARFFEFQADAAADPGSAATARADETMFGPGGASQPLPRAITESWACQTVGSNMRFLTSPPAAQAAPGDRNLAEPELGADEVETIEDLVSGQEVRLAVFMPDGSAIVGDPVWLNDDAGRLGMFTINPWTGLPMFERMEQQAQRKGQDPARVDTNEDGAVSGSRPTADDFGPAGLGNDWSGEAESGD